MKNIACLLLLTLLFAATFNGCRKGDTTDKASQTDTIPMLVMQIKKCSRLYTTEYRVHKIVTYNDVKEFSGEFFSKKFSITFPYTDRKVAIPMNVTLKGYIDFSNFSEENVQREGDKITIILPDPRIELTSSKIDQKGITEYVSLVRSHFTDSELSALEQQGREAVIKRIPEMGILETARLSAAHQLVPIITQLGYKEQDVTISFSRDFDRRDIRSILDLNNIEK
jgi:hypothetical protein